MVALFLTEIPPAKNIHLADANSTHLTVSWSPAKFTDCSDVIYFVNGSPSCGICTNNTTNTTATCTGIIPHGQTCNLSIETTSETCNLLKGTESEPIEIMLRGTIYSTCMYILTNKYML